MTGSLRAGWRMLLVRPERVLVPTLVLSTIAVAAHVLVQYLIGLGVAGTTECSRPYLDQVLTVQCAATNERAQLSLVLGIFGLYVVGQLVALGLFRTCLDAVDAVPVRSPFAGWVTGSAVLGAILAAALLTINTIFLVLPAVLLGFLIRYAPLFILDQGLRPVAALVASTRFVAGNLGAEAVFAAKAVLALLAGLAALGIGLYVAVPVVLLAQAQRYRARCPQLLSADRGY